MIALICKDFSQELFSHFAKIFLFIFAEMEEGLHIERDEPERQKPKQKTKNENNEKETQGSSRYILLVDEQRYRWYKA